MVSEEMKEKYLARVTELLGEPLTPEMRRTALGCMLRGWQPHGTVIHLRESMRLKEIA